MRERTVTHYVTADGRFTLCGLQVTRLWDSTVQVVRNPDDSASCQDCIARDALAWDVPGIAEPRLRMIK